MRSRIVTVLRPADAIALLKDKAPKEPLCLDGIGSNGKKLVVGRLSLSRAEHGIGRFYLGVFDSKTDYVGRGRVSLNRTFFTDPAAAVQAATGMGASQFQECKFAEMQSPKLQSRSVQKLERARF